MTEQEKIQLQRETEIKLCRWQDNKLSKVLEVLKSSTNNIFTTPTSLGDVRLEILGLVAKSRPAFEIMNFTDDDWQALLLHCLSVPMETKDGHAVASLKGYIKQIISDYRCELLTKTQELKEELKSDSIT